MARMRGNARKKKTRLTEQTLSDVMQVARPKEKKEDQPAQDREAPEPVIASILEFLESESERRGLPAAYNDASRVLTIPGQFMGSRYVLGLAVCPECHNEMMYYQDRDALAAGYRFRCRVCQHEVLATLE